jgi:hypothetical protein
MSKVYCGLVRIHFEVRECEEGAVEATHAQTALVRKCELFTPDYPTLGHAERALEAVKEAISIAVNEPLRVWNRPEKIPFGVPIRYPKKKENAR